MNKNKYLLVFLISFLNVLSVSAEFYLNSVRSIGLANVFSANHDSAEGYLLNPAGTAGLKHLELDYYFSHLNQNLLEHNIYFGAKMWKRLQVGLNFFAMGDNTIEQINSYGISAGTVGYSYKRYIANISFQIASTFLMGVNLKQDQMDIADNQYSEFNIDTGMIFPFNKSVSFGISALNVTAGKNSFNPFSLRSGLSFTLYPELKSDQKPVQQETKMGKKDNSAGRGQYYNTITQDEDTNSESDNEEEWAIKREIKSIFNEIDPKNLGLLESLTETRLIFNIDANYLFDEGRINAMGIGMEYWFIKSLALRSGISFDVSKSEYRFGLGASVGYKNFRFDYAFTYNPIFSNHFFSLSIIF